MRFAGALILGVAFCLMANAQGTNGSSTSANPKVNKWYGKTIDQWIKELKDADPSVRVRAAQNIPYFDPKDAQKAVPTLVERLKNDTDTAMRVNSCLAIGSIGVDEANLSKAIEALTQRLREEGQHIVRFHAAVCLSRMGTDARSAIPQLAAETKDQGSWEIRRAAIMALQAAGRDSQNGPDMRAVNAVVGALSDHSAQVRLAAASALGALGRPRLPADRTKVESALRGMFKDKDKSVVIWSYVSLMAIEDNTAEDHLIALAKFLKPSFDMYVRIEAAQALGTMKARAKSRVGDLADQLDDKEPQVAAAAALALGNIGPPSLTALSQLIRGFDHKDLDFKAACVWAVGEIGERASDAKKPLETLIKKEGTDEGIRDMARQSLKKIEGKPAAKENK
jgi:HEAT repeat protein